MRIIEAIGDLFKHLGDGDPVAWIGVGVFLAVAVGLGLFVLKVKRDLDREDRQRKGRFGGKG